MKSKTKKLFYRLLVAFLALVSAVSAFSGYAAFVVNRNYFPQETSSYEVAWPVFFVILCLALVIELFATRIYSGLTGGKKEADPDRQRTTRGM